MRNRIDAAAKTLDAHLSIHDLRTVPGPTHTNVIFDCLRPEDCPLGASEIKERLSSLVIEAYPEAVPKITIDEDYVSAVQDVYKRQSATCASSRTSSPPCTRSSRT